MPTQEYLSPEAIQGLINLMETFKSALRGEISSFKETGDAIELRQTLSRLRADLIYYNETFDSWHQNAETYLEYQLLDKLAKELGEMQTLLCKANKIIQAKL